MGSRLNPGRFDCHAAALDDEPRFTLLARDPLAGFLVSIWSSMRMADQEAAQVKFRTMIKRVLPAYWLAPDVEAAGEAIECAMKMFAWREANERRWRKPEERQPEPLVKALDAAVMALRSCQYGNAAPDLAAEIADYGEEALRAAGYSRALPSPGERLTPPPIPTDAPAVTAADALDRPATPGDPDHG